VLSLFGALLASCAPTEGNPVEADEPPPVADSLDPALHKLIAQHALERLAPAPRQRPALYALGRALFFDPVLSGNRDTSCASCHQLKTATTDGRSLSVGTAAIQADGVRLAGPDHRFTPRNTPALFNLGDPGVQSMFWDRRLEIEDGGVIVLHDTSYEATGVERLRFDADEVSIQTVQAMLPVLVRDEMRGENGETDVLGQPNELASIPDADFESVWRVLMERLLTHQPYRDLFESAYPGSELEALHFQDGAAALAHFIEVAFTVSDSPWDVYLGGEDGALSTTQKRGAILFFGQAACYVCHGGSRLTDDSLHNIGVRPITRGPSDLQFVDLGAAHRSHGGDEERFAFRTPSLHNVAETGPWMHNGAYTTLRAAVVHHLDYERGLREYQTSQLEPEFRREVHRAEAVLDDVAATITGGPGRPQRSLSDGDVDDLLAFLASLTAPGVMALSGLRPDSVPSGLSTSVEFMEDEPGPPP
jgi:cytochrome c peroxidase